MTVLAPDELIFESLEQDLTCDTETCGQEAVAMAVFEGTCCRPGFLMCVTCRDAIAEHGRRYVFFQCYYCKVILGRLVRIVSL